MQQSPDDNIGNPPVLSERKYKIIGLLIILFALLIRLLDLGERVFHHDESIHASFTLKLLETGQYSYDPAYHGPFLFHSTAVIFHFLGINDTTARLIPFFFGVAAIPLLFLLKRELGKRGVLWSAFLLSFSPSMIYFSRFFRNDMIIVFCTLATVVGGIRYRGEPSQFKEISLSDPCRVFPCHCRILKGKRLSGHSDVRSLCGDLLFVQVLFRLEKRKTEPKEGSPSQKFSYFPLPS